MTSPHLEREQSVPVVAGHEVEGVHVRATALVGMGLLLLVFLCMAGLMLLLKLVDPSRPEITSEQIFAGQPLVPGVQSNQAYDRERYESETRIMLNQYAWQDDRDGIARIPIDRAIALMARRKLSVSRPKPVQDEPPPPANEEKE